MQAIIDEQAQHCMEGYARQWLLAARRLGEVAEGSPWLATAMPKPNPRAMLSLFDVRQVAPIEVGSPLAVLVGHPHQLGRNAVLFGLLGLPEANPRELNKVVIRLHRATPS